MKKNIFKKIFLTTIFVVASLFININNANAFVSINLSFGSFYDPYSYGYNNMNNFGFGNNNMYNQYGNNFNQFGNNFNNGYNNGFNNFNNGYNNYFQQPFSSRTYYTTQGFYDYYPVQNYGTYINPNMYSVWYP